MTDVSEGSQAAVSRPDLALAGGDYFARYGIEGENNNNTIIRSAAKLLQVGKARLKFPSYGMYLSGATAVTGRRAPYGQFGVAKPSDLNYIDVNPASTGIAIPVDRDDAYVVSQIAAGRSFDELLSVYAQRSIARFVEQIEILGVKATGGLAAASTPFDTADVDVQSGGEGAWDSASSDPRKDIALVRETVHWANINTMYLGLKIHNKLKFHPALVAMFGGNVGSGGLMDSQIAEALELDYVYVGADALYGEYVSLCTQSAPGSDPMAAPSSIVYAFDPQNNGEPAYGMQYTTEPVPGTAGITTHVLARSVCDIGINGALGMRLTNTLT